jgi:hypothetical protein
MLEVTKDLKKRCDDHDEELVLGFNKDTWPLLINEYYKEGGTVTQRLQLMFEARNGTLMTMLFVGCKNAADRNRIAHSETVAYAMMVLLLAQASIDMFDFIERKIHGLLGNIISIVKSPHNEKMRGYAREMLRIFTGDYDVADKDGLGIRSMVEKFYKELTSEDLLKHIDDGISQMRKDYGRFVLANIAEKLRNRTLSLAEIRYLMERLGSFGRVRQLFGELNGMEYDFSLEPMDAIEVLPISEETTPLLARYMQLCHDGEKLPPDTEDALVLRLRELRQEARANGGVLPDGSLYQLYVELGNKKAALAMLAQAGDELTASRKRLNRINVTKLKLEKEENESNKISNPTGTLPEILDCYAAAFRAGGCRDTSTAKAGLLDAAAHAGIAVQHVQRVTEPGLR